MLRFLTRLVVLFLLVNVHAPAYGNYSIAKPYFNAAYNAFPHLPNGILEAVSWHQTHIENITSTEMPSCSGMPTARGYMGLITNGKGYFTQTAELVSKALHVGDVNLACEPQYAIQGYAQLLAQKITTSKNVNWNEVRTALELLSEIPHDSNAVNDFARMCFVFEVFRFLNDKNYAFTYGFTPHNINLKQVFGNDNYTLLTSRHLYFTHAGITNNQGVYFVSSHALRSSQYGPAIWTPAPSCNYSSRNGVPVSAITIHTVQGTYAGAISWAQNCNSSVSYHYVVRSSDGQITQMVDEAMKGWHVGSENPYTIGYEHEGYVSNPSWYTTAMYTASADLSRDICNSGYLINSLRTYYGASSSGTNTLGGCTKIKGHQHYPNQTHTDPGIYWDWEKYYKLINNSPSVTTITSSAGNFYDSGGPAGNYSDDERLLWLFSPSGASNVTLTFSQFDIETNWDYLFIYDGNSTSSPLIGVFTGTSGPGSVTSTGSSLLVEFRSDCNTVRPGWTASYSSTTPQPGDITPPVTQIVSPPVWVTQSFTASFSDADNAGGSGIDKMYYQVSDMDNSDWRCNAQHGFFSDQFEQTSLHADWTNVSGTWTLQNGNLLQTNDSLNNTNLYAYVNHGLSNRYMYHWLGKIEGTGTNRRAGLHYFCDAPTLTNRGNSYFVWFRLDNDQIEIYEVINDAFTLVANTPFNFNAAQWYDFKVIYDRTSGKTMVYIDNAQKLTWTDTTPLAGGDYISLRSGNSVYSVDNFNVYRSRSFTALVQVGPTGSLRYQNVNPFSPAGRIKSLSNDVAGNISSVQQVEVNIDTTIPPNISWINDGLANDIDTFYSNTTLEANWQALADTHSGTGAYWYAVGTSPGATNVVNWTNTAWNDTLTLGGLTLSYGTTYYVSVKQINGAGLESVPVVSDGMYLALPLLPPQASFVVQNTIVCAGDSVQFTNTSSNATSYQWLFPGAVPSSSTVAFPTVLYSNGGTYNITLIAGGPSGTDTVQQTITITVNQPPVAGFTVTADTVLLPNAIIGFTNASQNADGYAWYFGDGNFSNGISPWNAFTQPGTYTVLLIASAGGCASDSVIMNVVVLGPDMVGELEENVFHFYPNPASETICIATGNSIGLLELTDLAGKQVVKKQVQSGVSIIPVSELSEGMYVLKYVSENGKRYTAKLEIIRK